MRVIKHVEYLLSQGKKPQELVDLGFPKQVITKVRRQLREEKAAQRAKAAKGLRETKRIRVRVPERRRKRWRP